MRVGQRIGVKYCGGCNPEIDRRELIEGLARLLPDDQRLETGQPSEQWEIAILVCGCPVACLDRPEARGLARKSVLVSGCMVDFHPVPMDQLVTVAAERLQEIVSCWEGDSS